MKFISRNSVVNLDRLDTYNIMVQTKDACSGNYKLVEIMLYCGQNCTFKLPEDSRSNRFVRFCKNYCQFIQDGTIKRTVFEGFNMVLFERTMRLPIFIDNLGFCRSIVDSIANDDVKTIRFPDTKAEDLLVLKTLIDTVNLGNLDNSEKLFNYFKSDGEDLLTHLMRGGGRGFYVKDLE